MVERKYDYYESPAIEKFLARYKSKSTQTTYGCLLRRYFSFHNIDPDSYCDNGRNYQEDVERFFKTMEKAPAKTFNVTASVIKKFLMRNDVELKGYIWEDLKNLRTGSKPVTIDKAPTNQQLKEILLHGDIKTRAIGLMLSSSGMRIGEITKIQLDDIDWDSKPVKINIRANYTKSGNKRYVFISHEAAEALNQWLNVRDKYIKDSWNRRSLNKTFSKKNDKRVFPISPVLVRFLWNNCLEKAGYDKLDKTTKRHEMHIHVLRKFFLSLMKLEIPEVVAEALAGHDAYLSEAYRRYSEKQMAEYYMKGVNSLLVFERENKDISDVREEQKQLRDENKKLHNDVDKLRMELLEVKMKQVQELQKKIK